MAFLPHAQRSRALAVLLAWLLLPPCIADRDRSRRTGAADMLGLELPRPSLETRLPAKRLPLSAAAASIPTTRETEGDRRGGVSGPRRDRWLVTSVAPKISVRQSWGTSPPISGIRILR